MYRTPAERPTQHPPIPKPTERFTLARAAGIAPALGLASVVLVTVTYAATHRLLFAGIALALWFVLIGFVTRVLLAPLVIELDHASRRIRFAKHDLGFDQISHAESVGAGAQTTFVIVFHEGGHVARTLTDDVDSFVNAVNLALAAQYESINAMPEGLAAEMRKLAIGFPLSGLAALSPVQCMARMQAFLQTLSLTEIQVMGFEADVFTAHASAHGRPIFFHYNVRKDRVAVATPFAGSGRRMELIRVRGPRGNGWEEVTPHVAINGARNRDTFESMFSAAQREHMAREVSSLHLLQLKIEQHEIRAIARDGLRELRDPRARVMAMIDFVIDTAMHARPSA